MHAYTSVLNPWICQRIVPRRHRNHSRRKYNSRLTWASKYNRRLYFPPEWCSHGRGLHWTQTVVYLVHHTIIRLRTILCPFCSVFPIMPIFLLNCCWFSPGYACYAPKKVQYATFTQQKPVYATVLTIIVIRCCTSGQKKLVVLRNTATPVSYTHLTLPTKA